MYVVFDPPVSPFSPPEAIRAWIGELEQVSKEPEYSQPPASGQVAAALAQAREWLNTSLSVHNSENSRGGAK